MNQTAANEYNREILETLKTIQRDVAEIKARVTSGGGAGPSSTDGGKVADDRDLDGQNGDPTIKFDPRPNYWSGESYAGYRFSETSPDYLEATAKYLDACAYMAEKDTDEKRRKSARYKRLDAARARGWAARLRAGWKPPQFPNKGTGGAHSPATGGGDDYASGEALPDDDDIPF